MFLLSSFPLEKTLLKIKIDILSHLWATDNSVLLLMSLLLLIPRLRLCTCHSLVTHPMDLVYLYRETLLVNTHFIRSTFSFLFWLPGLQIIPWINKALLKCLVQVHVYEPTFYYEVWPCLSYRAQTRDMDEGIWGDNGYKTNHWFLL